MTDLKYRPQNLVSLLALVRRVLGVLHLVAEFEQRVFQVVEAVWRRFAITRRSYRRHFLFGLGGVRSRFASRQIRNAPGNWSPEKNLRQIVGVEV